MRNPDDLLRFSTRERLVHWIVALCFILLALSGLAFFHPFFWPLVQFFGTGVWARISHPFIGLLITVVFFLEFMNLRKLNQLTSDDWTWIKHMREIVASPGNDVPVQGKFNGGQKLLFWAVSACILLQLLSGLVLWRAYFSFPVTLVRWAAVIHAAAGAFMIALIIGHIYMAIWNKGTIRGMLYGKVSRAWALFHYEGWYRQMTGGRP